MSVSQCDPKFRWNVDLGCGGRRIWKLIARGEYLCAVVSRDGDWNVWLPGEGLMLGNYELLRDAKAAALYHFCKSEQ